MPYPSYARVSEQTCRRCTPTSCTASSRSSRRTRPATSLAAEHALAADGLALAVRAEAEPWQATSDDPVVDRGAYLVEGLGHCGACHTPRALTMQEKA
jgi:mono/diheme cytochrome c family protein